MQQSLAQLPTSAQQQFIFDAILNQFQLNVNLPGNGNEATGGLLSTFNIGNGLFTESITPAELPIVDSGDREWDLGLSGVRAERHDATGATTRWSAACWPTSRPTGRRDNNFVIEDPSLLGLPAGTAIPAHSTMGGTFNGSGSNDTFYFVGGCLGQHFGQRHAERARRRRAATRSTSRTSSAAGSTST